MPRPPGQGCAGGTGGYRGVPGAAAPSRCPRPRRGQVGKGHPGRTCGSPPSALPAAHRLPQAPAHGRTDGRTHGRTPPHDFPGGPAGAAGSPCPCCSRPPAAAPPGRGGRASPGSLRTCRGVLGRGSRVPTAPARQRAGGRAALLLLGRAAAQRRRYRNWLRLRETAASGGREAGAGRRCGVRSEPFIQEYPGLFLLRRLLPAPGTAQHGRRLGGRLAALTSTASSS